MFGCSRVGAEVDAGNSGKCAIGWAAKRNLLAREMHEAAANQLEKSTNTLLKRMFASTACRPRSLPMPELWYPPVGITWSGGVAIAIDSDRAGLDASHHSQGLADVGGLYAGGQAVVEMCRQRHPFSPSEA